jgi:hypothetical protein
MMVIDSWLPWFRATGGPTLMVALSVANGKDRRRGASPRNSGAWLPRMCATWAAEPSTNTPRAVTRPRRS